MRSRLVSFRFVFINSVHKRPRKNYERLIDLFSGFDLDNEWANMALDKLPVFIYGAYVIVLGQCNYRFTYDTSLYTAV